MSNIENIYNPKVTVITVVFNAAQEIETTLKSQLFKLAERVLKVHITPVHFYSPIPQIGDIDPSSYDKINDCVGLDFQEIPLSVFQNADILFIDSSQVLKIGSDVNYEMLEIAPSMKVGSIIQSHDIMIPRDYPKSWVENNHILWNESYMVHTFMLFNKAFKII